MTTTHENMDFIGGQGSLTAQEEKALSAYFQNKKIKKAEKSKKRTLMTNKKKLVSI